MQMEHSGALLTRRALLVTGALAGPALLAGCDDEQQPRQERDLTQVTLTPLTTAEGLFSEHPVPGSSYALSAREGSPPALLVVAQREREMFLHVATGEDPSAGTVPIDPATTSVHVDDSGTLPRVYARRVSEGRYLTTMLTSADLSGWDTADLGHELPQTVVAAGGGMVVSETAGGVFPVHVVAEDGTVTTAGSLEAPESDRWSPVAVARQGDVHTLLVHRQVGKEVEAPGLLRSSDGGATWEGPQMLMSEGIAPRARSIQAVGESLVVIGSVKVAPSWEPDSRYERPTAWVSADGLTSEEELVPLPRWGVEHFAKEPRGSLDPETEMDFVDLFTGSTVRGADGELHVGVHFADDARTATRAVDGTWSITEAQGYARGRIEALVTDGGSWILRDGTGIHSRIGTGSYTSGPTLDPSGDLRVRDTVAGAATSGVVARTAGHVDRHHEQISWSSVHSHAAFAVVQDRIELVLDLPVGAHLWGNLIIQTVAGGTMLATGLQPVDDDDEEDVRQAWVVVEGEWVEADGLARTDLEVVGTATEIEGTTYLPARRPQESGKGFVPVVLSSADGITWEPVGEVDLAGFEDDRVAGGAYIEMVTEIDETLVAVGAGFDVGFVPWAMSFVHADGVWTPVPVDGAPADSRIVRATVVGGEAVAAGSYGDTAVAGPLAADGTISVAYRSRFEESRDEVLDLGEGSLLAAGWIRRPVADGEEDRSAGIGSCLWASSDGGEHWDATMIPDQEGRFPDLHLLQEGDGLIVLVDGIDSPHGYRIASVAADVRGAGEV